MRCPSAKATKQAATRRRMSWVACSRRFGFGSLGLQRGDFTHDTVIQLGQAPRRIDLLTHIDGVGFEACFARRELVALSGVQLNTIGLLDFKANKLASGRLKDLADLESLASAGEPNEGLPETE
jgi:hypothetical protein